MPACDVRSKGAVAATVAAAAAASTTLDVPLPNGMLLACLSFLTNPNNVIVQPQQLTTSPAMCCHLCTPPDPVSTPESYPSL
jgi:hypothetical protein